MVKGSCICGDWTYQYEGEPVAVAVCHCRPCRKTAGTNGSVNTIIADGQVNIVRRIARRASALTDAQFKQLSGTDRTFTRKGDSTQVRSFCQTCSLGRFLIADQDVTYHNCATCGTIMWVEIAAAPGMKIVKTGTIDDQDALNSAKPVQEIYCKDRPESIAALANVEHKDAA